MIFTILEVIWQVMDTLMAVRILASAMFVAFIRPKSKASATWLLFARKGHFFVF